MGASIVGTALSGGVAMYEQTIISHQNGMIQAYESVGQKGLADQVTEVRDDNVERQKTVFKMGGIAIGGILISQIIVPGRRQEEVNPDAPIVAAP